jgi:hypothetical protein
LKKELIIEFETLREPGEIFKNKHKFDMREWTNHISQLYHNLDIETDLSRKDIISMLIILKHKIVKLPMLFDENLKIDVESNKGIFYDIFKNPSKDKTEQFFKDPLAQKLWVWFTQKGHLAKIIEELKYDEAYSCIKLISQATKAL